MTKIELTNETLDKYYKGKEDAGVLKAEVEALDLPLNEKIVFADINGKVVAKAKWKGQMRPLRMVDIPVLKGVKLYGDIEQQFVIDDIADPDIQLITVVGHAGTGKTFISLLGACVYAKDRVIYTRENVEVGRSLGFLPGGEDTKFTPYLRGLYDNLDEIQRLTQMDFEDSIEAVPIAFIRGASLRDTVMLVDEAQNNSVDINKTLISRIGEGSKIILCGSYNQIDTKVLNRDTNGLKIVCDKFRGYKVYGENVLTTDHRSELCKLADELLS